MYRKTIAIAIIAVFAFSTLSMTLALQIQTRPIKVTQETGPDSEPLLSELADTAFSQPSDIEDKSIIVRGKPTPQQKSYALTIEIDYMEGHRPTDSVLDYMQSYYAARGITITYDLPSEATVPLDNSVSDADFWTIEAEYNAGEDNAINADDGKYTLPLKWMLFGTTVEGAATTVGYTYCVTTFRDLVAGNYIFVADKAADEWANSHGISQDGAEAVLVMHEFGHSIGICTVRAGGEVYCSDYYCVMSYLRTQNAGNIGNWYYCNTHWKTKNLDYYVV